MCCNLSSLRLNIHLVLADGNMHPMNNRIAFVCCRCSPGPAVCCVMHPSGVSTTLRFGAVFHTGSVTKTPGNPTNLRGQIGLHHDAGKCRLVNSTTHTYMSLLSKTINSELLGSVLAARMAYRELWVCRSFNALRASRACRLHGRSQEPTSQSMATSLSDFNEHFVSSSGNL